ncbi:MAG: hypothetical protein P794_02515 [Epsilonproteobacteria bacterium (ex Lamellibrachia satsuma)]|nr:MAG: hypothetical protein P794_02515 [Epsilonproteobacteria bacterium (ex Lamellibrachia satsuma)]
MKKWFLLLTFLLSATLFASEPMLKETPFAQVTKQIDKGKSMMLEVGSDSCYSCQIMGRLLYSIKQKHPEYPIYFVNVKKEREAAFKLKIQMIPTQIVLDGKGNEVYRHIGVLSPEKLKMLLEKYSIH